MAHGNEGCASGRLDPRTRHSGAFTVVVLAGLLLGVAGCATPAAHVPGSASGSASVARDAAQAGEVAVRYATALFDGDIKTAGALVEPPSRESFGLVAAGMGQNVVHAKGLANGRTTITAGRAVTTLLGDLCQDASTPSAVTVNPADCISNHDPESTNPIFRVSLARQSSGQWLVTLSLEPGVSPPGGPSSPAPSASTSVPASR